MTKAAGGPSLAILAPGTIITAAPGSGTPRRPTSALKRYPARILRITDLSSNKAKVYRRQKRLFWVACLLRMRTGGRSIEEYLAGFSLGLDSLYWRRWQG